MVTKQMWGQLVKLLWFFSLLFVNGLAKTLSSIEFETQSCQEMLSIIIFS